MTKIIQSTIPVLASLDISESIAFYVEKLGFTEEMRASDYAIVSRDGAEIHLWLFNDRHIAENTSCYVRTSDTDALWREFNNRGLNLKPPAVRPWRMKELYVHDPHGNLLKFGEYASE